MRSESLSFQSAGTRCGAKARRPSRSALHERGAANDERAPLDGGFSTIPEPLPYLGMIGSFIRRRSLAISAGDRTFSNITGMSGGSSRQRFGRERRSDLADGMATAPTIMAPQICKALTALASTARHAPICARSVRSSTVALLPDRRRRPLAGLYSQKAGLNVIVCH